MIITITLREFADRTGMSDEACAVVGLNPWCLNEGLASADDTIELNDDQARKLGFIQ